MSLKNSITVFVLFTVLESVFGATCYNNNNTCVATTNTLAICGEDKVCVCKSPALAIRTGCGIKFGQPTLMHGEGDRYTNQIISGSSAVLTCGSSGATVYEWSLNDNTIFGANGSTYTITSANSTSVGPYKCKAKALSSSNLDSDYSAPLTLTHILPKDISKPVLTKSTETIFAGKDVTFTCNNLPIGYNTSKILYTLDTKSVYSSTITFKIGEVINAVKCYLSEVLTSSAALPTVVTDISDVKIENIAEMNNKVYTKDESIILTCLPTPGVAYIDKELSYAWLNNGIVITEAKSQTFDLPKIDGTYQITCQANYTQTPKTSSMLTITRDGRYLTLPVISAEPSSPVPGGHITLACGTEVDGASYSWKKDSSDITGEVEHKIQLDNLKSTDAGDYTCTIQKSMVIMTSEPFGVRPDILSVAIENYDKMNNMVYTTDESITLKCLPTPGVAYIDKDLSYSWLNNSVVITGANLQTYDLPKIDGTYQITCQANYTETPKTSSMLTITRDGTYLTKPEISAEPSSHVLGGNLTLACGTKVDGASYSWKKNGTGITGKLEHKIQLDNLTSTNAGDYTCTVQKSMVILTAEVFRVKPDISSVAIDNSDKMNNTVYTTDESITLKCLPTPDVAYSNENLSYAWLNNSLVITAAKSQTYFLPKIDGTYQITCQASYTETPKTSSMLTITRDGTYLTKPVISSEPSSPVLGGNLTLACGTKVDGASYSWKKDGTDITGKVEHKIQLDKLTSIDFGAYTCTVQKSMVILTSEAFGVSSGQEIIKVSMHVLGLALLMSKVFS